MPEDLVDLASVADSEAAEAARLRFDQIARRLCAHSCVFHRQVDCVCIPPSCPLSESATAKVNAHVASPHRAI
jgi:hypothetical protein